MQGQILIQTFAHANYQLLLTVSNGCRYGRSREKNTKNGRRIDESQMTSDAAVLGDKTALFEAASARSRFISR